MNKQGCLHYQCETA